jgi:nicotinate-nucleotide--dimethylbenzimidazole phosphoribosyltransferase
MSDGILETLGLEAISAADATVHRAALAHLDSLTKPLGSLGDLERLAARICAIQRTLTPEIRRPVAVVFAADHGVAERGVSAYPQSVTRQMVQNFLDGGAAISVLARSLAVDLWVVDAGVATDCGRHPRLIDARMRAGTRDFAAEPAMTDAECRAAARRGAQIVEQVVGESGNTLLLGEMGIGNTAAAALLMHCVTGIALRECVGRGTGLDDEGLARKLTTLAAALARAAPLAQTAPSARTAPSEAIELLTEFGGYEIAMLVGAMLAAASRRAMIVVDGFTVTVAVVLAARIEPKVLEYCVFSHCSAEHAHRGLLEFLNVRPLLDLHLRLGEGSGAALALPLIRSAVHLFTQMATFSSAGVSEKVG